jgi:predicted dienelactone hydrolase
MRYLFCAIVIFGSLQAMSKAPKLVVDLPENIGVHTEKFEDSKRNRPVVVEIWYPTDRTSPVDQPEDPVWEHPKEIRDAPPASGKFPLIMMSHGHGGDRRDRSWLVEYLVKSGYIVASVEHYGNSARSYNPLLSLRFWERARDITFALSSMLKDPFFRNQIDANRIGFVGYSLGGMTGLALGGARAQNVKEVIAQQQETLKEIDPELVKQIDFKEAQGSFLDKRIKALVLLSPAAFIYPAQSFKSIKVPVALVASEGDEILPHQEHALKIIKYLAPAKLKLLRDQVSHYVFLNRVSAVGKDVIREEIQTEVIQADRITVHKEVGDFVLEFFKEHLN